MVASKKWIKSVLGLQKGNKLQSSEQDENSSGSTDESWLQGKGSDETASSVIEKQPNPNAVLEAEGAKDATVQSVNHSDEVDSEIIENELASSVITEVEDAENSKFLPMKHSGENNSGIFDKQSDPNVGADINYAKGSHSVLNPAIPISRTLVTNIHDPYDTTLQSLLNSASSSSTSLCEKNADQLQQNVREERAATRIQGAFRRFLARRRLRALRGLVRLQALVTGRAVRKQASFTLHSMQDLVRVQVRARARRVRTGLENQIVQHKLHQEFEQEQEARVKQEDEALVKETGVKEIGGGWCGSAGSAEEIKARSLKRKEAAAKREKAMAYALARQWQASSRNRAKPASVGQDKICWSWSWNWWDTWMGSAQLENRVVDINLEDRTTPSGNEPSDAQQKPATRSTSAGKKAAADVGSSKSVRSSGLKPGITQELKAASSHCSSPIKSANLRETLSPHTPSRSPRSVVRDSGEVSSPRLLGARSRSTPKERSPLGDNNTGKKRLSLPETGQSAKHQFSQPAVQRSVAAPKHSKARAKSLGSEP